MIPLIKNNYSHKTLHFHALNFISTKKQSAFLTSSQDNPYWILINNYSKWKILANMTKGKLFSNVID